MEIRKFTKGDCVLHTWTFVHPLAPVRKRLLQRNVNDRVQFVWVRLEQRQVDLRLYGIPLFSFIPCGDTRAF